MPKLVIGEICIGGVGLAKSISQDKRVIEPYIDNPYQKNDKLYRTGDYGYYDENYNLIFVGRKDSLTKVNGYRIDLKEVNKVIRRIDFVQDIVTIVHENRLIVFIKINSELIMEKQKDKIIANLRLKVNRQLPSYMRPSQYCLVESIPMTSSGKTDVAKLCKLCKPDRILLPKNKKESILQGVFKEVLSSHEIGTNQSFFELGGNSLDAIKVVSLINVRLEAAHITIADLYNYPTIKELSKLIESNCLSSNPIIQLKQAAQNTFLFIHPVSGFGTCYVSLAKQLNYDGSIYIMNSTKLNNNDVNFCNMKDLVENYLGYIEPLLKKNIILCGWSLGGIIALELSCQLRKKKINIDKIILLDSQNIYPYREKFLQQNYDDVKDIKLRSILEMHHNIAINYQPPSIKGEVHILKTKKTNAKLPQKLRNDPYNGWSGVINNITSHSILGTHETLLEDKYLPQLVKSINHIINQ